MTPTHQLALSRRRLLQVAGGSAVTAFGGALAGSGLAQPVFGAYPFQLGVAAGDPQPDGFVIWTRLAPDPLEVGYGMPAQPVAVEWEVSTDERFSTVVRKGEALARPELGHAVHVELGGLQPDRPGAYDAARGRGRRSGPLRCGGLPAL